MTKKGKGIMKLKKRKSNKGIETIYFINIDYLLNILNLTFKYLKLFELHFIYLSNTII